MNKINEEDKDFEKYFLKGPIPLSWLTQASKLSGKVLHVSIALWFLYGINKGKEFKVQHKFVKAFGIHRSTFYKAIKSLETVGLIQKSKTRGQTHRVRIILTPNIKGVTTPKNP